VTGTCEEGIWDSADRSTTICLVLTTPRFLGFLFRSCLGIYNARVTLSNKLLLGMGPPKWTIFVLDTCMRCSDVNTRVSDFPKVLVWSEHNIPNFLKVLLDSEIWWRLTTRSGFWTSHFKLRLISSRRLILLTCESKKTSKNKKEYNHFFKHTEEYWMQPNL
jgi:hypothetical protein